MILPLQLQSRSTVPLRPANIGITAQTIPSTEPPSSDNPEARLRIRYQHYDTEHRFREDYAESLQERCDPIYDTLDTLEYALTGQCDTEAKAAWATASVAEYLRYLVGGAKSAREKDTLDCKEAHVKTMLERALGGEYRTTEEQRRAFTTMAEDLVAMEFIGERVERNPGRTACFTQDVCMEGETTVQNSTKRNRDDDEEGGTASLPRSKYRCISLLPDN